MNASTDKILYLLKTRGPQSAAELGDQLQMTSMGARQHLMALESEGWVGFSDEARGRGRPVRLWHLTDQAWQRFPDTHGDLTLQLIDDIRQVFGDAGMEQLITRREQQMQARYESRLTQPALADRLMTLNALLHHCAGRLSGIGGVARPGIVHRIDKDTSGLLVVAKTDRAHAGLAAQFAKHIIGRRYLAVVAGLPVPPAGRIETNLARSDQNRQ